MKWILRATLILLFAAGPMSTAQTVIRVDSLASCRLVDLEKQLQAGNSAALESFWREVAQKGSPLIEQIKENDKYVLVTFLWRANGETKNVLLISIDLHKMVNDQDVAAMQLRRLADSDVWFKSYRLRNDSRITYEFSPNDPLIPPAKLNPEGQQKLFQSYKPDPLNPLRTNGVSIAELPADKGTVSTVSKIRAAFRSEFLVISCGFVSFRGSCAWESSHDPEKSTNYV